MTQLEIFFFMLGINKENLNIESWNPLGETIKPNIQVVIKPNLVRHDNVNNFGMIQVVIYGLIISVTLDYVNI